MITIESNLVFALGGAVMHFLWQGALIGLIAAVILHGLRKGSAQARYAVACGALAVCLVVFVACAFSRAGRHCGRTHHKKHTQETKTYHQSQETQPNHSFAVQFLDVQPKFRFPDNNIQRGIH